MYGFISIVVATQLFIYALLYYCNNVMGDFA